MNHMKAGLTLLIGLGLLLSGCVPSVNPLYTQNDIVFDPALLGAWGERDEKETWAFEKAGENKYKLRHTDREGRTAVFEVHLVKLQENLFLDLYLVDPGAENDLNMNQLAHFGMIVRPAHMFMKVTSLAPTLQIAVLDPDWLKEFLAKNPKAVRHEKRWAPTSGADSQEIVLTAETKALQQFILQHINDQKAFGHPSQMQKKSDASAPEKK